MYLFIQKAVISTVEYDRLDDDRYTNIWLCGPAKRVFEGELEIQ